MAGTGADLPIGNEYIPTDGQFEQVKWPVAAAFIMLWRAPVKCAIYAPWVSYETAAGTASVAFLKRVASGTAPSASNGTAVTSGTVNMNSTVSVRHEMTLVTAENIFEQGDALLLNISANGSLAQIQTGWFWTPILG